METSFLVLQVVTNVLIAATLLVYLLQLRAMRRQIAAAREQTDLSSRQGQVDSLFSLVRYLQEDAAREARRWVINECAASDIEDWNDKDRVMASRVCSGFDLVGIFARDGIVPLEPILEGWAPSICRTYEVTAAFRRDLRAKNGPGYWAAFDWLYKKAREVWKVGHPSAGERPTISGSIAASAAQASILG